MIIDQLPLLSGDAQTTDELPIERGTTTYKVTLDRLLAALPKDSTPTHGSSNVVTSGGVYSALATKQDKITANGVLKGNGNTVSAATIGTDYTAVDDTLSTSTTKTYSVDKINSKPNPNLLENWYFVGGGSQHGYGYFPLNSKGQTVYSGSGETINQWFNNYGTGTVQLLSNGLRLSEYQWFSQYLEPVNDLVGKTLTGTVLLADGSLFTGTIVYTGTGTQQITQITSGSWPTYLQMNVEGRGGCIRIVNYASGTPITVVAVKLEIGSNQTLAHQENGAWVLNEVPRYGEEYAETIASRSLIKAVTYSVPASVFGSFAQGELKQVSYTFPTAVPGTVINACMYGAGGWQVVIQIDALSATGVVFHCANVGQAFTFNAGRELTVLYY